jgi:CRP/FNR family transcriptional regulator, cyclic AMP receptor protein
MSEVPEHYFVFADDRQVYGPADSELLKQWAQDGLISSHSWVYIERSDTWTRGEKISVLNGKLASPTMLVEAPAGSATGLKPGQLRRIRLFADMADAQIEKFLTLVEKVKVRSFQYVVRQGEHGDSMFLILEGEARVATKQNGKEDTIATLSVGDFFGEVALLDNGPRSADVVANSDCVLLKLSKQNLENIISQEPEVASRFLMAMNRFLGSRIRATTERFTKAQNFAMGSKGQVTAPSGMTWKKGY